MSLTVCCVLKTGGDFNRNHVISLYKMVKLNLSTPFEFCCLTDLKQEHFPDNIKAVPFRVDFPWKWCKINIWNPENPFNDRVLFLDLDSIVVGNLDEVVNFSYDFGIVRQWKNLGGRFGRERILKYKSPLMVWDHNSRKQLWNKFSLSVLDELVGDQDWIGSCCPEEKLFPDGWFNEEQLIKSKESLKNCKVVGVTNKNKNLNQALKRIKKYKNIK